MEYFIESAWSLYSIRPGCWSMKNLTSCTVPRLFEFELELEKCIVMVFNTTKLLRYEKAHSLRGLLVSAARVHHVFILVPWFVLIVISGYINNRPLTCIYLNDKHAHCYSSLSFKAQTKWPTILKVVHCLILSTFEVTIKWDTTFLGLQFSFCH